MGIYETLIEHWTDRRRQLEHVRALVDPVCLIDDMLDDIAKYQTAVSETVITLKEASIRTGYSVDHLARLVRQGKIPNAGRYCAPRVRIGDLPQRRQFARTRPGSYDVMTDARLLRTQR